MTNKNTILALAIFALVSSLAFGQVTMTTTTTSNAINATATAFNVASATGIVAPSFAVPNQPTGNQTILYVDHEAMFVTGLNGTYITVIRGYASTIAEAHVSGATVWVGPPSYFSFNEKDHFGACTATNETSLPKINVDTGHIFTCGSNGQWAQVMNGTQTGSPSSTMSFACTGTVGSAETEFVGSTVACSGSTSDLITWTATTAGTVANLRASSSANFLGTGGSIFTVMKNDTAVTGFTCAPTAATKQCANMLPGFTGAGTAGAVNSVTVAAGDRISVRFLSSTSDTAANLSASLSVY